MPQRTSKATAEKTKKWAPPKGWLETEERGTTEINNRGERTTVDLIYGRREYDDGTIREIVAHTEDEFTALAAANDENVARQARMTNT